MKRIICLLIFAFPFVLGAQEIRIVRKNISKLSSAALWGRGYTKEGMEKAAGFIISELKNYGLQPMGGKDFRQQFSYAVNTFPGKMELRVNGKMLVPGKDFIIEPSSSGQRNKHIKLEQRDSASYISPEHRILLSLQPKLTWSVAPKAEEYTVLQLNSTSLKEKPDRVELNIENRFIPSFKANNICAFIKGSSQPDSIILLTAHYDHLGGMGDKTYFPGANDNGSGISMLLSLARYYAKHPPRYSIGLICFAGEEAGLLGSAYFTANPLIPLNKIKFMINMDMVGTGDTGITVVNATLHPTEFALLNQINDQKKYLVKINSRGKAANSDHYYFSEKGVPAFFIYTQGGIAAYHDIMDKPGTLPLTEFADLRQLIIDFTESMTN